MFMGVASFHFLSVSITKTLESDNFFSASSQISSSGNADGGRQKTISMLIGKISQRNLRVSFPLTLSRKHARPTPAAVKSLLLEHM